MPIYIFNLKKSFYYKFIIFIKIFKVNAKTKFNNDSCIYFFQFLIKKKIKIDTLIKKI